MIPSSVTGIGGGAFNGCESLTEVIFEGDAPSFPQSLFDGVSGEAKAYINSGASGFGAFYSGLPVLLDPVVALEGESVIRHRTGRAFVDPGAKATDRKDGDLTIQVEGIVGVHTQGEYWLTYSARDSEGNQAEPVTRLVRVVDSILPLIFLNGTPTMVHEVGTQFIDPGATALDRNDGSIAVDVTGSVNVFNTGVYILTYSVQDEQGNTAEAVTREVWVVDGNYK